MAGRAARTAGRPRPIIALAGRLTVLAVAILILPIAGQTHPNSSPEPGRGFHGGPAVHPLAGPFPRGHAFPPGPPSETYTPGASHLESVPTGSDPTFATLDTRDGYLYVTDFGTTAAGGNNVTIVDAANGTVVANVPVGDDPINGAYDPVTGYVYVLNYGTSCNVTVMNRSTILKWIPTGCSPISALYDPSDGYIYVSNSGSGNVSILSGTSLVATIPTGAYAGPAAYDPTNGYVYVPNGGANNVTVLHGTSVVTSIGVGGNPQSAIYDPLNGYVYIPNFVTNNISVLNGTAVLATIAAGTGPTFGTVDSGSGWIYVADQASDSVDIFNGTSRVTNVSVGSFPRGAVYDSANGLVYVPIWSADQVTVFNGTRIVAEIAVGVEPYSAMYDPAIAQVFVCEFNSNTLTALGTPASSYPLVFTESGLPTGTNWSVGLGSTTYSGATPRIGAPEPNGTHAYSVEPVPGFAAVVPRGNVTVSGGPANVSIAFVPVYPISFHETGLTSGTPWNVTLGLESNSSMTSTIQFFVPNGTYSYSFGPVAGFTAPTSGSVGVSGAGVLIPVSFSAFTYAISFNASGLMGTFLWSVTLGNETQNSSIRTVVFHEPNGSYSFVIPSVAGYLESPGSGRVTVNASAVTVPVSFRPIYPVNFTETGLPAGANWSVQIGSSVYSTLGPSLQVARPNGSYSYALSTTEPGFVPAPASGMFSVTGGPVPVAVTFQRIPTNVTYAVVFAETGLSPGTLWYVSFGTPGNLSTNQSRGSTIGFGAPNGSYLFSVNATGYLASPANGTLDVNGSASVASPWSITFQAIIVPKPTHYRVDFIESGLPLGTEWSVTLGPDQNRSANATISFFELNGSYDSRIGPTPGFATDRLGRVQVAGRPVWVNVSFVPVTYPVTFRETGLADGTSWTVSAGTVNGSSLGTSLTLRLPNGTFPYSVGAIDGYLAPPSGSVEVNGSAVSVPTLVFSSVGSASNGASPSLSTEYIAGGLGAAAVVVLLLVLLLRRRQVSTAPSDDGLPEEAVEEPVGETTEEESRVAEP